MKIILIVSSLIVIFITSFIAINEIIKAETKREKLIMVHSFFLTPPLGADMVHFFYWFGLLGLVYSVFLL